MLTKTPVAVLAAFCFLMACRKNEGPSANSSKLKWYIEQIQNGTTTQTDTFNVSYDNSNRITGLTSQYLNFVYTYGSGKSFTLDLYEFGLLTIHEIAYLNGIPYIDSTFQYDNTSDTSTEKYLYSGSLLARKTTYIYSSYGSTVYSVDDYTYDGNGNMLKDVTSDGQGNIAQITSFTYTNDPVTVTVNPAYFPPQSKDLPATEKVTDGAGDPLLSVTYSYVFDGSGRLTKETDAGDNGETGTKIYVYD